MLFTSKVMRRLQVQDAEPVKLSNRAKKALKEKSKAAEQQQQQQQQQQPQQPQQPQPQQPQPQQPQPQQPQQPQPQQPQQHANTDGAADSSQTVSTPQESEVTAMPLRKRSHMRRLAKAKPKTADGGIKVVQKAVMHL